MNDNLRMKPLTSILHLYTAALERREILVYQAGELIGGGKIEEIREETLKIRDEWFMRGNCTFLYA